MKEIYYVYDSFLGCHVEVEEMKGGKDSIMELKTLSTRDHIFLLLNCIRDESISFLIRLFPTGSDLGMENDEIINECVITYSIPRDRMTSLVKVRIKELKKNKLVVAGKTNGKKYIYLSRRSERALAYLAFYKDEREIGERSKDLTKEKIYNNLKMFKEDVEKGVFNRLKVII